MALFAKTNLRGASKDIEMGGSTKADYMKTNRPDS